MVGIEPSSPKGKDEKALLKLLGAQARSLESLLELGHPISTGSTGSTGNELVKWFRVQERMDVQETGP